MLAREYWVDSFSQFCRAAIEKLTENILEHSLQNEKKEANYEKILFPAGAAGGV